MKSKLHFHWCLPLPHFLSQREDSIKSSGSYSWMSLFSVAYHGEGLSTSCLSVRKDTDVVAIHSWLDQVLQIYRRNVLWHQNFNFIKRLKLFLLRNQIVKQIELISWKWVFTLVSSKIFSWVESSMKMASNWNSFVPLLDSTLTVYSSGDFSTE